MDVSSQEDKLAHSAGISNIARKGERGTDCLSTTGNKTCCPLLTCSLLPILYHVYLLKKKKNLLGFWCKFELVNETRNRQAISKNSRYFPVWVKQSPRIVDIFSCGKYFPPPGGKIMSFYCPSNLSELFSQRQSDKGRCRSVWVCFGRENEKSSL